MLGHIFISTPTILRLSIWAFRWVTFHLTAYTYLNVKPYAHHTPHLILPTLVLQEARPCYLKHSAPSNPSHSCTGRVVYFLLCLVSGVMSTLLMVSCQDFCRDVQYEHASSRTYNSHSYCRSGNARPWWYHITVVFYEWGSIVPWTYISFCFVSGVVTM